MTQEGGLHEKVFENIMADRERNLDSVFCVSEQLNCELSAQPCCEL